MAKRIKFIISRIFPSFQSCRSQDPSTLPENPVPITTNFNKPNILLPPTSFPSQTDVIDNNPIAAADEDDVEAPEDFKWKKDAKWHVISRVPDENAPTQMILNSLVSDDFDGTCQTTPSPIVPETEKENQGNKKKKKKRPKHRTRISTSSAERVWFSSEAKDDDNDEDNIDDEDQGEKEGEGTESLFSFSRTLSSPDTQLETIRETPVRVSRRKRRNARRVRRVKYCAPRISSSGSRTANAVALWPAGGRTESHQYAVGTVSPVRLSVLGWLVPCALEGKVRESFAVVKKSEDPYEDFKRSMVEMIVEKEMVEAKDLEQLLQCFLSLNSRNHHGIIVEAFSEICEALFCESKDYSGKAPFLELLVKEEEEDNDDDDE